MDRKKHNSRLPVVEPKFAGGRRYNSILSAAVPVKIEEDVIVINGIPVPNSGKRGSSASSSRTISTSSSSGGGGSGSGSDNRKFKSELHLLWESFCPFRSDNFLIWMHDEYKKSSGSSPLSYGPIKLGSTAQIKEESTLVFSPSTPAQMGFLIPAAATFNNIKPISDWSPEEDGIQVILPTDVSTEKKISSKRDVDAHINKLLYGNNNSRKKRLPVFQKLCPDE